jgi:hypothetical protein
MLSIEILIFKKITMVTTNEPLLTLQVCVVIILLHHQLG